jgi:hypothetical protein
MKMIFGAFVTLAMPVATFAFAPSAKNSVSTRLHSTMEMPPVREAPAAGYLPDWEDREGLKPDEFLESDMSKSDLSGMWECPLTRWDSEGYVR